MNNVGIDRQTQSRKRKCHPKVAFGVLARPAGSVTSAEPGIAARSLLRASPSAFESRPKAKQFAFSGEPQK
jgi:hypothetical protein